jgi:hypothetical protein
VQALFSLTKARLQSKADVEGNSDLSDHDAGDHDIDCNRQEKEREITGQFEEEEDYNAAEEIEAFKSVNMTEQSICVPCLNVQPEPSSGTNKRQKLSLDLEKYKPGEQLSSCCRSHAVDKEVKKGIDAVSLKSYAYGKWNWITKL